MPPLPLLAWRRSVPADLERLAAVAHGPQPPPNCPPFLARHWQRLRAGVFIWTLDQAIDNGPRLGVTDGGDICRVLAATAQTLRTRVAPLRVHNRAIVHAHLPVARPVSPLPAPATRRREGIGDGKLSSDPHVDRADERGARVETERLVAIYASHKGPAAADHPENQDAAFAATCGETLVFALADGVTTSTGSRYAAAFASESMCALMSAAIAAGRAADRLLLEAVQETQRQLDARLAAILETEDLTPLRSTLPPDSTLRILTNTQTAANPRIGPAMSTTLVAGFASPSQDGGCTVHIILVGDGVVERVGVEGSASRVVDMDSSVMKIAAVLGPGPRSRDAIARAAILRSVDLGPSDLLLISSDGLTRGHSDTVWSMLPWSVDAVDNPDPAQAWNLLEDAARIADARAEQEGPGLFADNLSLIIVGSKRGRP